MTSPLPTSEPLDECTTPGSANASGGADPPQRVSHIASLLHTLDELAAESGLSSSSLIPSRHENNLVQARLGIASGLFSALRSKHAPTASHCLRVALGCSSWAAVFPLSNEDRDALEVAALLHDVGKIGVPDSILLKPGRLLPEEANIMSKHRQISVDILAGCGAPKFVLDIVQGAGVWYGGSVGQHEGYGDAIPLTARMLAIVDAFDSMITDHVYRPARSRERALAELYKCTGRQFDPELVQAFSQLFTQNQDLLTEKVASRWLHELPQTSTYLPWRPDDTGAVQPTAMVEPDETRHLFEEKLIDNMHDGVVFVDSQLQIFLWNTGAERLTGVSGSAACGRILLPSLLDMCDESGSLIADEGCPIAQSIRTGVQNMQRLGIIGRGGERVNVDMHAIPVRRNDRTVLGATVLLHDASSETSLEEKCQALHAQVAKDPLTQVANRAEFDRMLALFIEAHQETGLPCSLIMTDIDHFKSVNDSYGHQAGDEAIIAMASLLTSMCRAGDLVARYGGEEFAVLCADCNNATAVLRGESIRKELAGQRFSFLGNNAITASFGVTELQPGDTPETMLRRADRALLQAKDQGRNQVVQLGVGMNEREQKQSWWPFANWRGKAILESDLVTMVPIDVAIQKLRGFIADHQAKIVKTDDQHVRLEVSDRRSGVGRRRGDRSQSFSIDLWFSQEHIERTNAHGLAAGQYVQTNIEVVIRPRRDRDRRRESTTDKARLLLGSLKSYLMAKEVTANDSEPREQLAEEPVAAE